MGTLLIQSRAGQGCKGISVTNHNVCGHPNTSLLDSGPCVVVSLLFP